jgi:hypothetical protein
MNTPFDFRIEWQNATGVTTPELAATWARYEIWLGDRRVTQVEASDVAEYSHIPVATAE